MKISVSKNLDALRGDALHRIDVAFRRFRQGLGAANDDIWAAKESEARRILGGGAAGPLLGAEALERGVSLEVLARTIVERADYRATQLGFFEAARQAAQARVRAAATPAAIEAVALEVEAV